MRTPTLLLIGSIVACVPVLKAADTFSDFSGALTNTPSTIFQAGQGSFPVIMNEPPAGDFLRLMAEQGSVSNHIAFDATHTENWSSLVAQFDFRLINNTADPADGIGLVFLPVLRAGVSGVGIADFVAEEPNTAGALGVGVDLYPNVNDVSLHWNGLEQTNAYTNPALVNFLNSGWNRVAVSYTQVGNGLNASVTVTKDIYGTPVQYARLDQAIDARPYANRVQISGRTGGADMSADIDNVAANYSGAAAILPTIDPLGRVLQDFDSLGATPYLARLHSTSPDILRTGPKLVATGGSGGGAYLQLMPDGQNDTISSISLQRAADGGIAPARRLEMDFRMSNPDGITAADGMGFLLLPTSTFNVAGAGPGIAYENTNVAGALGIGLRAYDAGAVNRVQLHWNNSQVAQLDLPVETLNLLAGTWNRLQVDTEVATGGSNVSVSIVSDVNGAPVTVPIFTNTFIAGMNPYDYRIQTGARSGGLNLQADVDNVRTFPKASSFVPINNRVTQNFDGPGTFYQATDQHGFAAGTDGTRHAAIVSGGPSGNFLRLAHAVNGQNPNIGFDQAIPNGTPKPQLEASFDFRMTGQITGVERADGFGFGLFGTGTYGTTGPIITGGLNWETPNLVNALTLGVRIYDADASSSTDYLTVFWNGSQVFSADTNTIPGLWDLNNNLFHNAKLTLKDIGTDTLISLTLSQDSFGANTPLSIFTDLAIVGLDLDTFDFRVGFGARTGGLNADFDFDNLIVTPEPGSALLMLGGFGMICGKRRRRIA